MNVDTGYLRELTSMEQKAQQIKAMHLGELQQEIQSLEGMTPVPPELNEAAKRKLAGEKEAYVSLTSGGELSKWAAKERKKKRQMAADSRRRNRPK